MSTGGSLLPEAPLIAFCHLSWNWVWQRPQQFLSRLSAFHPLLFVETYCSETPAAYATQRQAPDHPRVTILEMHLPTSRWSEGAFIDTERRRLMTDYLKTEEGSKFAKPILWFNDPMAVTAFAGQLGERMIVYDCMDELTQFKDAPAGLAERERELTLMADIVFCGGRRMREKRLPLNPNTHFYGTGVDCGHFAEARRPDRPPHSTMAPFARPVLGYFGVIDERIDYPLLAAMADQHAEWNIVMIGPFAKVSPDEIPRRTNLHWVGPQSYQDLPALTAHMDLCLMPFALNAATEYINPTKALEYMAAGKPIISTALHEVISNFEEVCRIGRTQQHFIELCEEALADPCPRRVEEGVKLASQNTWDAIAAKMEGHIRHLLVPHSGRLTRPGDAVPRPVSLTLHSHV